MAESETLSVASPLSSSSREPTVGDRGEAATPPVAADWRPKRLVRTVLASLACSKAFGKQMVREAKRRRFFEAAARAFLGDGLSWNWSIWKEHFPTFTPILDFIHVLSYIFVVAKAVHQKADDAWDQYVSWMRGCWQGDVAQVLDELKQWQTKLGEPPEGSPRTIRARSSLERSHTWETTSRGWTTRGIADKDCL